jgi:hypothetical protein
MGALSEPLIDTTKVFLTAEIASVLLKSAEIPWTKTS